MSDSPVLPSLSPSAEDLLQAHQNKIDEGILEIKEEIEDNANVPKRSEQDIQRQQQKMAAFRRKWEHAKCKRGRNGNESSISSEPLQFDPQNHSKLSEFMANDELWNELSKLDAEAMNDYKHKCLTIQNLRRSNFLKKDPNIDQYDKHMEKQLQKKFWKELNQKQSKYLQTLDTQPNNPHSNTKTKTKNTKFVHNKNKQSNKTKAKNRNKQSHKTFGGLKAGFFMKDDHNRNGNNKQIKPKPKHKTTTNTKPKTNGNTMNNKNNNDDNDGVVVNPDTNPEEKEDIDWSQPTIIGSDFTGAGTNTHQKQQKKPNTMVANANAVVGHVFERMAPKLYDNNNDTAVGVSATQPPTQKRQSLFKKNRIRNVIEYPAQQQLQKESFMVTADDVRALVNGMSDMDIQGGNDIDQLSLLSSSQNSNHKRHPHRHKTKTKTSLKNCESELKQNNKSDPNSHSHSDCHSIAVIEEEDKEDVDDDRDLMQKLYPQRIVESAFNHNGIRQRQNVLTNRLTHKIKQTASDFAQKTHKSSNVKRAHSHKQPVQALSTSKSRSKSKSKAMSKSMAKSTPTLKANQPSAQSTDSNAKPTATPKPKHAKKLKPIKLLFLDVDGVLNYKYSHQTLSDAHIIRLKKIIARTKCKICLSSTWRKFPSTKRELMDKLRQFNINVNKVFIGSTPIIEKYMGIEFKNRAYEIDCYLQRIVSKYKVHSWCAVDDYPLQKTDAHSLYILRNNFIQTDARYGLSQLNVEQIVCILNHGQNIHDCKLRLVQIEADFKLHHKQSKMEIAVISEEKTRVVDADVSVRNSSRSTEALDVKLVFLEVNGVLNYRGFDDRQNNGLLSVMHLRRLKAVLEHAHGCVRVVLISEWRLNPQLKECLFKQLNSVINLDIGQCILGDTPVITKDKTHGRKNTEILQFLETLKEGNAYNVLNWIVIDSMPLHLVGTKVQKSVMHPHLIQTDVAVGLSEANVKAAISLLNE